MSRKENLGYLLNLFSGNTPAKFLRTEIDSLRKVVRDILLEMRERSELERTLLSGLEKRVMALNSKLGNWSKLYWIEIPRAVVELQENLDRVEIEKARARESSAKDLIELKKLLWHYWLLLRKKEAQLYLFS